MSVALHTCNSMDIAACSPRVAAYIESTMNKMAAIGNQLEGLVKPGQNATEAVAQLVGKRTTSTVPSV